MEENRERIAMKVSRHTIAGNVLLAMFKLFAAVAGHSAAMLSDAVHSLSDVFSTFVVMIGMKIAGKNADREHPYGHERFECVAALILSVMLFLTGLGIGYGGIRSIAEGGYRRETVPGVLALAAAVLSIVVKEAMFWYTRVAAKKINSGALMADAWHHRSDALSSIGSFIGISGARLGYPALDPAACLVICVFICRSAWDIFTDAINKMTDKACDGKTEEEIRALILAQEKVYGIDLLQTRLFGDKIYVDVEISANGEQTLYESHNIAQAVHDAIESRFENVKHCMVHVNPK